MIIRLANIMDIEKILLLEEQVFNFHLKVRPDLFDREKRPFNYEYMKYCIENKNGEIFIAEDDNKIIGHCIVSIREMTDHEAFYDMKNVEIEDLCVDEQYRKKGIGKKLFEEVKKYAKENGIKYIELQVWEFNKNAREFYEHLDMKTRLNIMELIIE
jgi:ribosomal protein S18 acetylase RimI-like enzyme